MINAAVQVQLHGGGSSASSAAGVEEISDASKVSTSQMLQQLLANSAGDAAANDGDGLLSQFHALRFVDFLDSSDSSDGCENSAANVGGTTVSTASTLAGAGVGAAPDVDHSWVSQWLEVPPAASALGSSSLREFRQRHLRGDYAAADGRGDSLVVLLRCESFLADTFDGLRQYVQGIAAGRRGRDAQQLPIRVGVASSKQQQQQVRGCTPCLSAVIFIPSL